MSQARPQPVQSIASVNQINKLKDEKLMNWTLIYCFIINFTSSDGYVIFIAVGTDHILQRRFEDIRIELRQCVIGQVDEFKFACRNNMKLIK